MDTTICAPTSRHSNPFATCWTRPGAIPFQFPNGSSSEELVQRLEANGWWGEIVGPHGSGKSTLLETLKPTLRDTGRSVHAITLREGQRWLPKAYFNWEGEAPAEPTFANDSAGASPSRNAEKLLIIDGYEQLGWLQRIWLNFRCRRTGTGLLVTSHVPTGLQTLVTLAPDLQLIEQLAAALSDRATTRITAADVSASHAGRGSNVRDIFFDLYDRHEQLRSAR